MEPIGWLALSGTLSACVAGVWGVHAWSAGRAQRRAVIERLSATGPEHLSPRARFAGLDSAVRRTRLGRRLERRLAATGLAVTPGEFSLYMAIAIAGLWLLADTVLAPFFGPIAGAIAAWSAYAFLAWRRQKRIERFIGQLPELSRLLANGSSAGLALRTAIGMAADELDSPAGEELTRVADALAVGHPLEDALNDLKERLPSRELAVLVTTLVLSSRAGGTLVESLRNLTETLEERKETRREVRTTLSQVTITSYAVPGIGLGTLLLINRMAPGSLDTMTGTFLGQSAVIVSVALYGVGFLLIRRMAKIDV
ncbi:type II secretion system F family protein [Streptantibioticus ferralitis]|uniref:Type II secretion system F family protein n=1 Tax=Streptantibioticus ferralitis TaxID=236510 RepID=A0ABT5ZC06_9ACTN|nr:type II secretion system F family protein [Streptantibioticus ferralitis]MDF2261368.1 type II secretion system F family protein [Streptantibioticus ferralitis]